MRFLWVIAFGLLPIIIPFSPARGCGPCTSDPMLSYARLPDCGDDMKSFVEGNLGIIRPELFNRFKIVAYRYLTKKPLSREEKVHLLIFHDEAHSEQYQDIDGTGADVAQQQWQDARKKVTGLLTEPVKQELYFQETEVEFRNCLDGALLNAAQTLNQRIEKFGAADWWVKNWLQGQDQVFQSCSTGNGPLPEPISAEAPELFKQDRAYQIAAAHFYRMEFDEAIRDFKTISKDTASPWHDLASYLVARSLLRKASFNSHLPLSNNPYDVGPVDQTAYKAAADAFSVVEASAGPEWIRKSAAGLRTRAMMSADPQVALEQIVSRIENGTSMAWDIVNFTIAIRQGATINNRPQSDLLQWLAVMSAPDDWPVSLTNPADAEKGPTRLEQALEQYATKKSLPWLLAVASLIPSEHPEAPRFAETLAAVTPDSPAYATALYHRIRLLWRTPDQARDLLLKSIKAPEVQRFASTKGSFSALAAPLAASFEEFLETAEVPVVAYYSWCDAYSETSEPEEDSNLRRLELSRWTIDVFNRLLPLQRLLEASRSSRLTNDLRQELARAVFVRASLLARKSELLQAARQIRVNGEDAKKRLKDLEETKSDEELFRRAMFLIMHAPAFRPRLFQIHHLDVDFETRVTSNTNWWCAPGERPAEGTESTAITAPSFPMSEIQAGFLSPEERNQAHAEQEALKALPSAPDMFLTSAIRWSKDTPKDSRVPEALHLAIKSSRWSTCAKVSSQEAFKILHAKHPQSPWAKKTPHWYAPS